MSEMTESKFRFRFNKITQNVTILLGDSEVELDENDQLDFIYELARFHQVRTNSIYDLEKLKYIPNSSDIIEFKQLLKEVSNGRSSSNLY